MNISTFFQRLTYNLSSLRGRSIYWALLPQGICGPLYESCAKLVIFMYMLYEYFMGLHGAASNNGDIQVPWKVSLFQLFHQVLMPGKKQLVHKEEVE